MVWNISYRPLAELISLFPFTLTHIEKLIDARLKKLQEEKQHSKSEFEDRSVDNFEIDMSISFFNQIKEFFHQRHFKELVKRFRAQEEK